MADVQKEILNLIVQLETELKGLDNFAALSTATQQITKNIADFSNTVKSDLSKVDEGAVGLELSLTLLFRNLQNQLGGTKNELKVGILQINEYLQRLKMMTAQASQLASLPGAVRQVQDYAGPSENLLKQAGVVTQVLADVDLAIANAGKKRPVFTAVREGLKELHEALLQQLDPKVIDQKIQDIFKSLNLSRTSAVFSQQIRTIVTEGIQSLRFDEQKKVLADKIQQIIRDTAPAGSFVIEPIVFKDLQVDKTNDIRNSFAGINEIIQVLTSNTADWDRILKATLTDPQYKDFKNNLEFIIPLFEQLTASSSTFGNSFNSAKQSSTSALAALSDVLKLLGEEILNDTTLFQHQRDALNGLATELQVIRSAGDAFKPLEQSVSHIVGQAKIATNEVQRVVNTFASVNTTQPVTYGKFDQVDKEVRELTDKVIVLKEKLTNLQKSGERATGENFLPGNLQVQLNTAISSLNQITNNLTGFRTQLDGIKTTKIKDSLTEGEKAFAIFEKKSIDAINNLMVQVTSLGQATIPQNLSQQFADLAKAIDRPIDYVTLLSSLLTNLGSEFKANTPSLRIYGVKETYLSFESLITIVKQYLSQLTVVKETETLLAAGTPVHQQASQELAELNNQLKNVIDLENKLVTERKSGLAQQQTYDALVTTLTDVKVKFEALVQIFNTGAASSTVFSSTLLADFKTLDNEAKKITKSYDGVIEKLKELQATGTSQITISGGLSTVLPGLTGTVQDVDKVIEAVGRLKEKVNIDLETIKNQFNVPITQELQTQFTEIEKSIQGLKIPTTYQESVTFYQNAVTALTNELTKTVQSVSDFTGLQTVYSQHKAGVQSLYDSLVQVEQAFKQLQVPSTILDEIKILKTNLTGTISVVNTALQQGGSSLDSFLKPVGRFDELNRRFTSLRAEIDRVKIALGPGNLVSTTQLDTLRNDIQSLVTERTAIITAIDDALRRLNKSFDNALRVVTDPNDLNTLKTELKKITDSFDILKKDINSFGGSKVDFKDQFKSLVDTQIPFARLTDAIKQADIALQGFGASAGTPLTSFNQGIQSTVAELERVRASIGTVRTSFEEKPREVLQTFMEDLKLKASEVRQAYVEVQRAIQLMENSSSTVRPINFGDAQQRAQALKVELETLSRAMETLSRIIKRVPEGSNTLKQYSGMASSMDEVRDSGALLTKGLQSLFKLLLNQNAKKFSSHLQDVSKNVEAATGAFRQLEEHLVGSLRNLDMMAFGLQMVGQAAIQPFKNAIDSFGKFEDILTFTQGVIGSTQDSVVQLAKGVEDSAATTRHGVEEQAQGLKQLALAGYDVQQSVAALPQVLKLGTAAEMQVGEATATTVQIMSSQRLGMEQLGGTIDQLVMAANRTISTVGELGVAFRYIGSLAGTLKNDFSDTAAAVALLHNAGLKGSMAGTALRGMLQALLNPTADEAKLLEDLSKRIGGMGLQIYTANGKFVGFTSILKQLERAGITTGEVLNLFGQRAGPGMAALVQMGSDKLQDLVIQLEASEGFTANLATRMENTLSGKFEILKNNIEVFSDSIGHNISGMLKVLTGAMTEIVVRINHVRESLGPLTVVVDDLALSLAGLLFAIGSLSITWTLAIVPAKQFWTFLVAVFTFATKTASALWGLQTAIIAVNVANASQGAAAGAAAASSIVTSEAWKNAIASGSRLAGLLVILRAGLLALVTTPVGWLVLILSGLATAALIFGKNMSVVNAQLDRQIELAKNNAKEFENLGNRISRVVDAVQKVRIDNLTLKTGEFVNLAEVQKQKAKLTDYLNEMVERFNESSDRIKQTFKLDKIFSGDKLVGLRLVSIESGKVLTELSTSMLDTAENSAQLQNKVTELTQAFSNVANLDGYTAAQEKFNNVLKENLNIINMTKSTARGETNRPISLMEQGFTKMLELKQQFVETNKQLDVATAANDQTAVKQLQQHLSILRKEMQEVYNATTFRQRRDFGGSNADFLEEFTDGLNLVFQDLSGLKVRAADYAKSVNTIVKEAIQTVRVKKSDFNMEDVLAEIDRAFEAKKAPGFLPKWVRDSMTGGPEEKAKLMNDIKTAYQNLMQEAALNISKVSVDIRLDSQFTAGQRITAQLIKNVDDQSKQLATKLEAMSKNMEKYKTNADAFIKYRDLLAGASKANLDVGIGNIQAETDKALTQMTSSFKAFSKAGTDSFQTLDNAAIGYGKITEQVDASALSSFISYHGKIKLIAQDTSKSVFSYYHDSAEKQIDDLERTATVMETVYGIPGRLIREEKGNFLNDVAVKSVIDLTSMTTGFDKLAKASEQVGYQFSQMYPNIQPAGAAIREYFSPAIAATGTLIQYTITFNDALLNSKLKLEQGKLKIVQDGLAKELAETDATYAKLRPLYADNSEERIKLEQEYQNKKKGIDTKGIESTKSALDRIKELYKQNADKIKKVQEDLASFMDRVNKKKDELNSAGLNDTEKLEKDKSRITQLIQQANLASLQGNLDKAKALYSEAMSKIEGITLQPWDQASKDFLDSALQDVSEGMSNVSSRLVTAGQAQQNTLENSAHGLEKILDVFQTNLKGTETELGKLAEALVQIQTAHAKEANIALDNAEALDKLKQVTDKKQELDRLFEAPVTLQLNTDESLAEMKTLAENIVKLKEQQSSTGKVKLNLENLQQEQDKVQNLRSAYQQLSDLVNLVSKSQLPATTPVGTTLTGVSVEGSDNKKKYEELTKALVQYQTVLNSVSDSFTKANLTIPPTVIAELNNVQQALTSLKPDSNDNVTIQESLGQVLGTNIQRYTDLTKVMSSLNTQKQQEVVQSLVTTGQVLKENTQIYTDLNQQRIGGGARAQSTSNYDQQVITHLKDTVSVLKEIPTATQQANQAQAILDDQTKRTASGFRELATNAVQTQVALDKPLTAKVEVSVDQPTLQTTTDALKRVRVELDSFEKLQSVSNQAKMTVFDPQQLQAISTAKDQITQILQATDQDQVNLSLNPADVTKIFTTLETIRAAAEKAFSDLSQPGSDQGLQTRLKALTEIREKILAIQNSSEDQTKLPITLSSDYSNATNELLSLQTAYREYGKVKDSAARIPLMTPEVTSSFTKIETQLNQLKTSIEAVLKTGDVEFSPQLFTTLDTLTTDLAKFKQQDAIGITVDSTELTNFQQKLEELKSGLKDHINAEIIPAEPIDKILSLLGSVQTAITAIPKDVPINSDSTQIENTLKYLEKLVSFSGTKVPVDVIVNQITQQGRNAGGLIQGFAEGGVALIKKFAKRGYNRLSSSIVPGSGNKDTVPAMLTPGEFVIRKSAVRKYGLNLLNAINEGWLQFKALGGVINQIPHLAAGGLAPYMVPSYAGFQSSENAKSSNHSVDVRLHIGDTTVKLQSSREQVNSLVNALNQVKR